MTFEEAKKILKEEFIVIGFHKTTEPFEFNASKWFEHEKPSVLKAFRTLGKKGYYVTISGHDYDMRKKRLEEEYEKNTKASDSDEEQPKEDNPALKEAASQFNDSLLDEQAKKIEKLTKENEDWKSWNEIQNRAIAINNIVFRNEKNRLGKEIARLNKIIHKKNMKIEELKKERSEHLDSEVKFFGETVDLSQEICDKNEELRLSKIREKNLAELGLKYVGENEKLKKELADKVVDKIDAQALKSAESALAEKDEVIADLGNELAATKKELEAFKESYKRRIKEDSEHFEHIQKICNAGLQKWLIESEYLEKDKPFRFPQQPELSKEELMKIQEKVVASCDIAEEGGDQSATIVQCDNGITLSKEEAEIIERCTKNGTELHYSEKYGLTYTNMFGEELPVICLRGMFYMYTDEEIKNMKK